MKKWVLFMISMAIPVMVPPATAQPEPQDPPSVELEIKSLEARRFKALTAADVPALEKLVSDDLVYTHATGWRQTKAEFLASVRTGEIQYHSFTSADVKLRVYGGTALVTGRASVKARAQGQELDVDLVYLEAFVKQDGGWLLVAWQSTRT